MIKSVFISYVTLLLISVFLSAVGLDLLLNSKKINALYLRYCVNTSKKLAKPVREHLISHFSSTLQQSAVTELSLKEIRKALPFELRRIKETCLKGVMYEEGFIPLSTCFLDPAVYPCEFKKRKED